MPELVHITARGIVINKKQILFIERWKGNQHYFSLPGGHVEPFENEFETVQREIHEETTISVKANKLVIRMVQAESVHSFYECQYMAGKPELPTDSEEYSRQNNENKWHPMWISLEDIKNLPFSYWEPIKSILMNGLANGFNDRVAVVNVKIAG